MSTLIKVHSKSFGVYIPRHQTRLCPHQSRQSFDVDAWLVDSASACLLEAKI